MNEGIIYIVDDDDAVRDALTVLMRSVGLKTAAFSSADEFVDKYKQSCSRECVVLDVRMPGMSGLDLLRRLAESPHSPPVILLTGNADVPMAVESLKMGAVDFIQKPFRDQELLDRVYEALALNAARQEKLTKYEEVQKRIDTLTPREREVLQRVVAGHTNKQIAYDLNLSERTVEIHRAHVMTKMDVGSLPELVDMLVKHESLGRHG